MKLAAMQPYFFPYLGYYQGICAVDKYILYDRLAYIKEGWMNRNRFLVVNGEPAYFTVRLKNKSSNKKIRDIELAEDIHWRKKILKSLYLNYKTRSFFDEIYALVERVLNHETPFLFQLNTQSILEVCQYLDIKTVITSDTSQYIQLEERLLSSETSISDYFPSLHLNKPDKKVIRALEICRMEGANTFINAIGGQALYDKDEFKANGIELFFVQTRAYQYPQRFSKFFPGLSIIDVLMSCGKEGTQQLLQQYDLV